MTPMDWTAMVLAIAILAFILWYERSRSRCPRCGWRSVGLDTNPLTGQRKYQCLKCGLSYFKGE